VGKRRVERLEQVRELVLSKGSVTAQELANALGTSRRTIYRYVESLRESGFAIESCPGSTGGLRISSAEKNRGLTLTEEESMAILLVGSAVSQNDFLPYNDSLDSALEKIRRSLSKSAWAEIQETMPNVSVMVDKLSDCHEIDSLLEEVTEAIAHKCGIAITYYSLHRDAYDERQIDPYHLFYQGGAWYVIGHCHVRNDVRTFRLDRIKQLGVEERTFQRPKSFSLYGYLGSAWGIIRGQRNAVKIRFSPPLSRLIVESQWHPTQQLTTKEDGSVIFTAEVDGLVEIRRWVLGFGECAEVIEPQELRESIKQCLGGMANVYCDVLRDKA